MEDLELYATVDSNRGISTFESNCTRRLGCLLDGCCSIESQIAKLQQFRDVLFRVVEEELSRSIASCDLPSELPDTPFIAVYLQSGDFTSSRNYPGLDFRLDREEGEQCFWRLVWGDRDPRYTQLRHFPRKGNDWREVLQVCRSFVEARTATWFAKVDFSSTPQL